MGEEREREDDREGAAGRRELRRVADGEQRREAEPLLEKLDGVRMDVAGNDLRGRDPCERCRETQP